MQNLNFPKTAKNLAQAKMSRLGENALYQDIFGRHCLRLGETF